MGAGKSTHTGFVICISTLVCMEIANADAPPVSPAGLPNVLNTSHQCVVLAQRVLTQGPTEGRKSVPELISCLEGDYFYFDKGAAKVALKHVGEPAVPYLVRALEDSNMRIAGGAAFALGMIGPAARGAVPALRAILRTKPKTGEMRQREAAVALGRIGEVEFFVRALQGKEEGISQYLACQGLAAAGPAAGPAVPALMELLNEPDRPLQMYAADALGEIGPAANSAVPRLKELSGSSWNFVRRSAGEALLKIGTAEAREAAFRYEWRKKTVTGFFRGMSVFVAFPWLAAVFGVCLGGIAFLSARKKIGTRSFAIPLYAAAVLWIIYAGWEFYAGFTGANIRVDLFLIYPVLVLATVVSMILWFIGLKRPDPKKGSE